MDKTVCPVLYKIALEMGTNVFVEKYGGFLCPFDNASQQAVQDGQAKRTLCRCLGQLNQAGFCDECGKPAT